MSYTVAGTLQPRTDRGRKTMRRVQVAIARKLRMRLADAFPEAIDAPEHEVSLL